MNINFSNILRSPHNQGNFLIEFIIILIVISFLMFMGFHSYQGFLMRQERKLFLTALKDALAFARSEAFFRNTHITLCGSHSHQKCHMQKDWSSGFIIFENPTHDIEPKPEKILRVVPGIRYGTLQFNGTSPLLHISASGMTMSIGTFLYCPKAPYDNKDEIQGLVLNRVFRSYFLQENPSKVLGLQCR